MEKSIVVQGAKTNNLKNINLSIPRSKITAIVGVSGAGKTSLAFNTIYAEGYLRYIESISPYIRQFLDKIEKPAVERIDGLPPALSFRYKKPVKNPRSIVATSLDIFDYLRIIYSKISDFYCPSCGIKIIKYSIDEIIGEIFKKYREKIDICFEYSGDISYLINRGYYFHIKGGTKKRIDNKSNGKKINVLIDSIEMKKQNKSRLFEAIDRSISFGKGKTIVFYEKKKVSFPVKLFCPVCLIHFPQPDEHLFSFNSPKGACPDCKGFGDIQELDRELIFDKSLSISGGAILPLRTQSTRGFREHIISNAEREGIDINKPLQFFKEDEINFLMFGKGEFEGLKGFFDYIKKRSYKIQARVFISRYTSYKKCVSCNGTRFNKIARSYKFQNKNIAEFLSFTIEQAYNFIKNINIKKYESRISLEVFRDVKLRLKYLIDCGLTYIHLNRHTFTLSKGEFQRINLAFILSSTLSDSLLIIDQPSSDLHPYDYKKLKKFLINLRKNGNTILIIEHSKDIVKYCDYILEMGPSSGKNGGNIVFSGWTGDFLKFKKTITQKYFNRPVHPKKTTRMFKEWFFFKNAATHNLKNLNFKVPRNAFTVIAGVSGAGKTTLLYNEIFLRSKSRKDINDIIFIDPGIDRVKSRSNVAGFFEIFVSIRELFSKLKESNLHQYTPGHFSFNSPLGRCDKCRGKGSIEIEMQFLPSVRVKCDHCLGNGFKQDILKIKYKSKNIVELLDLSINESFLLIEDALPETKKGILTNIIENGMGYIKLGQKLKTLSSGELQRIKLIKYLNMKKTNAIFLIDEPSFGLHYHDIEQVKHLFDKIVNNNNTIVAVEHNLNLIMHADYIIELGPEGGDRGGYMIFHGNLKDIISVQNSITGRYIKKKL